MAINLDSTLRKALKELRAERERISEQIAAIETVLATGRPRRLLQRDHTGSRAKASRKRMSAAARKAVSRRMKAYWVKRRAQTAKRKEAADT